MQSGGPAAEAFEYRTDKGRVATALTLRRRFFGLVDVRTIFRGPVWLAPPTDSDSITAYRLWREQQALLRWRFVVQMPEATLKSDAQAHLRSAGCRRIMTGFATSWVDLAGDIRAGLDGKWRNQLKKAETSGIDIATGGRRETSYQWLLDRESGQRRKRGYHGLPTDLIDAYRRAGQSLGSDHNVISITAMQGRDKIAGALFLLHGKSATYYVGWSGDAGRAVHAQNLVLYKGAQALKERGIAHLDLGGINTGPLAGITRFKLGMGGSVHHLIGSYL